jgi:hypothetical protein
MVIYKMYYKEESSDFSQVWVVVNHTWRCVSYGLIHALI